MTSSKTLGILVVGLGGSAAGIFGAYKLLEPRTVESKLLWDGYSLLKTKEELLKVKNDNEEESKKEALLKFIKDEHQKEKINIKNIKESCANFIKKDPTEENMETARLYCARKN